MIVALPSWPSLSFLSLHSLSPSGKFLAAKIDDFRIECDEDFCDNRREKKKPRRKKRDATTTSSKSLKSSKRESQRERDHRSLSFSLLNDDFRGRNCEGSYYAINTTTMSSICFDQSLLPKGLAILATLLLFTSPIALSSISPNGHLGFNRT